MKVKNFAVVTVLAAGLALGGCSSAQEATPKAASTSVDWSLVEGIQKPELDAMDCERLEYYVAGRDIEAKANPDNANAQALSNYTHAVSKDKCSALAKKLGI